MPIMVFIGTIGVTWLISMGRGGGRAKSTTVYRKFKKKKEERSF